MKQLIIAAMVIALTACAASGPDASVSENTMAAAGSSATESAESTASETPDGVVCRWEKRPGSNFREKICRTVAEIEARAEQDQDALRQMRAIRSGSQADMGN